MKAYKMAALKRAVLIVLMSAMVVTPSSVRAGQAAAKGTTPPAQAVDKVNDDDTDQAQKQEEAKQRERERQEREQERQERERERADRLYEKGTRALDKRQYEDAAKLFDELIQKGGDRVEGAHYWKAYAEYKQGQFKEALAT